MDLFAHESAYRTEELMKKIKHTPIVICGVGAIGSNLIETMVRQGFETITAIDMDRVESHNRNSQIWGRRDVGQLKTRALKSRVFNDMGVSVSDIPKELNESNITKIIKPAAGLIVVDGFDNPESRQLVTDYCDKNRIKCLHVGLFQDYAEVIWNEFYRVPKRTEALDVCEYPLARNVVWIAVSIATEVIIRSIDKNSQENYTFTMKDFNISPASVIGLRGKLNNEKLIQ
jgi:molybdopterin/thiamine biosynthesis adenylyltransferase